MGKFTCHTPSGSSIVDYFIASSTLSTDIQSMFVNDLSLLSDHCMLTLKLKISIDSLTNDIIEGLDGGSWYSLITKNLAIYALSLKFWLIH